MRSRLGALLLVATLALGQSACPRKSPPRQVTIWHSYRGAEQRALQKLVRAFHASEQRRKRSTPGYEPISIRLLQISFDNLPNKITNAVPRGHGPDLFIFAHDRLGDWAGKGLVEPIGYWITPAQARAFLPKTLKAFAREGRLWGLPLTYKSVALFYHADLVGAAAPGTAAELIKRGRAFMSKRGGGHYGLVYEAADTYFHAPWLFGHGGRFLTACAAGEGVRGKCGQRGARLPIHSPQAVAALRFARKLAGPGGIVPKEVTGQLVTSLFTSKRAAMAITGPWFLSDIEAAAKRRRLDVRVAALPVIAAAGGGRAAPLLTVEGIYLSSASKKKKLAFRVMRHLTSAPAARERLRLAHQLPAQRAVDAELSRPGSRLYSPLLAAFRQQLQYARITPSTPLMRVIWEPYKQALAAVINRGEDPDRALKKAATQINGVLGSCLGRRR